MKTINKFILERLKINKNDEIKFNPDTLCHQTIILYDDTEINDEDKDIEWENCESDLKHIDDKIYGLKEGQGGFVCFRFKSISKSNNIDNDLLCYNVDLLELINEEIITGKDYGYIVRVTNGHIEIDCLNSGNRATYYIYGLSYEGFNIVDDYFNDDTDLNTLIKALYNKDNIINLNDFV